MAFKEENFSKKNFFNFFTKKRYFKIFFKFLKKKFQNIFFVLQINDFRRKINKIFEKFNFQKNLRFRRQCRSMSIKRILNFSHRQTNDWYFRTPHNARVRENMI